MVGYCKDRYYRVAVDIPGACLTQYFDNKPHTLQAIALWLDDVIDNLNLSRAHFTAHSTMMLVSTFYGATRPHKVTSLTLIGIPEIWDNSAKKPGGVIEPFRNDVQLATLEDVTRQAARMFYNPPKIPKTFMRHAYQLHQKNLDRFLSVRQLLSLPPLTLIIVLAVQRSYKLKHGK